MVGGCGGGPDATGARCSEERRGAAGRVKARLSVFSLFCFLFFAPLHLRENIILNVFPGDEGLQEVPPMCKGPQVPPHK